MPSPSAALPPELAAKLDKLGQYIQYKHRSDGLTGTTYLSMRCSVNLDGCDDPVCVCVCHVMPVPTFATVAVVAGE